MLLHRAWIMFGHGSQLFLYGLWCHTCAGQPDHLAHILQGRLPHIRYVCRIQKTLFIYGTCDVIQMLVFYIYIHSSSLLLLLAAVHGKP